MNLSANLQVNSVQSDRRQRGATNHASGHSAEDQVARHYERRGAMQLKRRWRGKGGEIDLILKDGDEVIFVEVKSSKTHARAASLLTTRQITRLCTAAEEFLGTQPRGSLTPMRMDVALVDGTGTIEIIENALAAG